MKKLSLAVFLFTIAVLLCGAPVSSEEAIQVGQKWLRHINPDRQAIQFEQIQTIERNDIPLIYILPVQGGGFVLVAADDVSEPILAYSSTGSFDYPITSPEIRYWIGIYENQLLEAVSMRLPNTEKRPVWDDILAERFDRWTDTRNVNPLLSTTWDQGQYYNQLCPYDASGPGQHAWAGCVATAMGQVMKYWSHPAQGTGSNSYTDGSAFPPAYGTISANFSSTTYSWSSMPNALTTNNTAVATLLFHCGVAVDMDYGVSAGSGALVFTNDAMKNNFAYDPAAQWQWRSSYSDTDWMNLMKGDLNSGRPIIYQGYDPANPSSGHSFVMDGYNSSNYFHFNFGWSGMGNGYFLLTSITPTVYSTTYDFTYTQWAYFNIYPGVTVSGTILDASSNPIPNVSISFSGAGVAITNSSGFYSISLPTGYSGTATPSGSGYSFTPSSISYSGITANQYNQNYSGSQSAPQAPTNLVANPVAYNQIDLSWTDNSTNESGFTIDYRSGLDLTWYFLTNLSADQTFFTNYFVSPSTSYAFRIMAYNSFGNSAYAYSTPVTTPPPPAPINLNTMGITQNNALLNWTEPGSPSNWEIEFGPAGFTLGTGTFLPGILMNPFNLMGLTPGTSYDWYVRSNYFMIATSPWAGPCNFTTQSAGLPYPWSENFENGFVNLVNAAGNNVPWTLNTTLFSEGVQSAHNAYTASNTNILSTISAFDLSLAVAPMLYFDQIAKTETNWDHCYVEISNDNGVTYTILPPHTYRGSGQYNPPLYNTPEGPCFMTMSYSEWGGTTPDNTWWKSEVFDLSGYTGQPNIMLRFRLKSDSSTQQFGWLIDNVEVKEAPQYDFAVNPPVDAYVGLGLSYDYFVTITNTGAMPDSYFCTLQMVGAWNYGLYEADGLTPLATPIALAPSGSHTFVVKVTTPTSGVNNFDMDYESFMVTSLTSGMAYVHLLGTMVLFGDTVADAIVIGSLPFTHSGSTGNYNHNYGPYGLLSGLINLINAPTSYFPSSTLGSSPDVVYQLTLSAPTMISIDLLGSAYDTAVALVTAPGTNPTDVLLINDDFYNTPVNFVSYMDTGCNAVPAGTYYIIVGGYGSASGNYSISVTAAPTPVAPNVTVSYDITTDTVNLSWTQNPVMRYNIYSDTNPYGSFSNVVATNVNASTYTIPGIPANREFYKVTEKFCYTYPRAGYQDDKLLPAKE